MIVRAGAVAAVLLSALVPSHRQAGAQPWSPTDNAILSSASSRLAHTAPPTILAWLNRQHAVENAAIGRDGRTIDIVFRGGTEAAILPASLAWSGTPAQQSTRRFRPLARAQSSVGRALVLEPFATELTLGPHAGDIEVNDLQYAGFHVDQAYDEAVTVSSMASLSHYNVVYMLTHSGVNQWGEGVIATGQLADGDPAVAPLIQDHSVIEVGVVGSTQRYYGILSHYIQTYEGQFPQNAIVFLNGCSLLKATLLWQALSTKGVATMISWDEDSHYWDDSSSAAAFYATMIHGATVSQALDSVRAQGLGVSTSVAFNSHIGYLGDGGVTLTQAAGSSPTASATLAPTATATATPTLTPVAAPHIEVSLKHRVPAGSRQIISISSQPGVTAHIDVSFPRGRRITATATTHRDGTATYSYVQPASTITPTSRKAAVMVVASHGGRATVVKRSYTVGFAAADVAVEPVQARLGGTVKIWVHASARSGVVVSISANGIQQRRTTVWPAGAWTSMRYRIPASLRARTLTVAIRVHNGQAMFQTAATIRLLS
jgi:hypothetical protein